MKRFVLLCSLIVVLCSLSYANGGPDCTNPTVIPTCPYSDAGNLDGENTDCSLTGFSTPFDDVFYTFNPAVTAAYQMRFRISTGTVVPGIRVVQGACCTSGSTTNPPNWSYSGASVSTDCGEPANVTYLYVYLTAGVQYWIHVGTNAANTGLLAYEFSMWVAPPCPTMEPAAAHNTCETAFELAVNDSIMGDSAISISSDWYRVVVPDYSPLACSLAVFVGGNELGHCISGRYPGYTVAPYGGVNGRFTLYRAGVPCGAVADSVSGGNNESCLQDAKKTMAVDPGTYYIRVWNGQGAGTNYSYSDYVLTTRTITYNPIAACCFTDGSCSDLSTSACALAGGWSKPVGVFCATNPCPTAAPGANLDNEPLNNACGANAPEVSCNNWYSGVINPKTDADWYKLILAEGVCESLVVDIYGNATPSKWPFGQGLNPYVSLYAADCATVLTFNDNAGGTDPNPVGNDSRITRVLKPGTYYIKVNSATSSTSGPYLMHLACPPRGCLPGDFCSNANTITALPYMNVGSTAWYFDDYRPTCMQGSLGNDAGGPDVIYTLQLDGNTCVTCSLTTNVLAYGSISLYANCPTDPAEPCIAKSVEAMSGPYVISGQGQSGPLPAGTYYVLVDELSGSINYTLKVSARDCPYPCETYAVCGSPGEAEPNNTCPPPTQQAEITCGTTVYGLHCPATDDDFWKVTVAPMSVMTIRVFTGTSCDVNPASGILFGYYDNLCANPRTGISSSFDFANVTADPAVRYLEVYDSGLSQRPYKVEATCCEQTDFSANPIVLPHVVTYTNTANSCCAYTNPIATIGGHASGADVIYMFSIVEASASNSFTVTGAGDNQIDLFTDLANPAGSVVAQADNGGVGVPETLSNVPLTPGIYYVGTSDAGTACGPLTLTINSDVMLPVELQSAIATPGDESVTVHWVTSSETNNDRFEVLRNDVLAASIHSQGNGPVGHNYTWVDANLRNGTTYTYALRSVSLDGTIQNLATMMAVPIMTTATVTQYALYQNYPNPFNPTTSIALDLVEGGFVSLKVYNLMGQEVATLINRTMSEGRHIVSFDASNLPSGIYLYRIASSNFTTEKKMLLMK